MATARERKQLEEQKARAASLNPEEMQEGGGLLDNIRATVTEATFEMSTYGGKSKRTRPAAHIVLEDSDGKVHDDQYWSCGKAEDWMPSDDGKYLIPTGMKTQIHKSSNFGMLMQSLLDCGFPADKFDADLGFIVGMEAHWQQVVVEGRDKIKSKDGIREYDPQNMVVAEIFKFPWEKKGGKAAKTVKKKAAAKKAAARDEGADDVAVEAQAVILQVLSEAEGTMPKTQLPSAIMTARKGEDTGVTNQIIKLAFSDDFLGSGDNPWTYEDGVLVFG